MSGGRVLRWLLLLGETCTRASLIVAPGLSGTGSVVVMQALVAPHHLESFRSRNQTHALTADHQGSPGIVV